MNKRQTWQSSRSDEAASSSLPRNVSAASLPHKGSAACIGRSCESLAKGEHAGAASGSFKEAAEAVLAYAIEALEKKHQELIQTMEAGLKESLTKESIGQIGSLDGGYPSDNGHSPYREKSVRAEEGEAKLDTEEFLVLPLWAEEVTVETAEDFEAERIARLQYRSELEHVLEDAAVLKGASVARPKGFARLMRSPTTPGRVLWDLVGAMLLAFDAIIIPLAAFDLPEDGPLFTVRVVALMFWTLDIPATFLLGYYRRDGELEMRPLRVACHYICSLFFLDVMLVGCDWATDGATLLLGSSLAEDGTDSSGLVRFFKMSRVIRLLRVLRAVRLVKLRRVVSDIQDKIGMERSAIFFSLGSNIVKIWLVTHYLACLWYWIGKTSSHGWLNENGPHRSSVHWHHNYLMSLHWSIANFTPGSSGAQPRSTQEYLMSVLVLYFAMVIFSVFVSSTTSLINRLVSMKASRTKQMLMLKTFMKQNNFDPLLRHRILRYVEASMGKRSKGVKQEEVELLNHLSGHLLEEVQMHLHFGTLGQHQLFRVLALSNPLLARKLSVEALTESSYYAGDLIFSIAEPSYAMGFLIGGILAYSTTPLRNEDGRLHDEADGVTFIAANDSLKRQAYCEASLWTTWHTRGNLQAETDCTLLQLSGNAFRDRVKLHPHMANLAGKYAKTFVKLLNKRHMLNTVELTDLQADLLETEEMQEVFALPAFSTSYVQKETSWLFWQVG